jgi:hypothetical protein
MHVLCVDGDSDFSQAIVSEAKAIGVPITLVSSLEQAKQKIQEQDFSAYIMSSEYDERNLLGEKTSTSLVYKDLPEVSNLKDIKAKQNINFVVGKPMSSNEAHYLLAKLCNLANRLEPVCDWLDDIPEKLSNEYLRLAYERLAHIAELIQKAKTAPSEEVWLELQNIVHKIAGSAGSYGRTAASEICKEMEIHLKNKDYEHLNLDSFYRQLYLYIQ